MFREEVESFVAPGNAGWNRLKRRGGQAFAGWRATCGRPLFLRRQAYDPHSRHFTLA